MIQYILNLIHLLDQAVNTILGGDPQETLSSRMGKYVYLNRGSIPCYVCKFLDLFEKDHCLKSVNKYEGSKAVIWEKK